jgi:tetratricopeptide (TPR) repeat protein
LLYRLALAQQHMGNAAAASETAAKALAIKPDNLGEHYLMGYMLENMRGGVAWAEAEYRHVLNNFKPGGEVEDFACRFQLAEILHDRFEELAAAETLEPVIKMMQKDEQLKEKCEKAGRDPEQAIARMHYLFACHYHEQKDWVKERQHLRRAIETDETDADVLIAMFRLPETDEAWKAMTKEKIEAATADFRAKIDDERAALEGGENDSLRLKRLAIACNQFAWLVGNTIGDHAEAVKRSEEAVKICEKSLDLRAHLPGFLDTLGRCFYGAGDVASAVKNQSQAVALNPDSGQIRRQLEFFKAEAVQRGVKLP